MTKQLFLLLRAKLEALPRRALHYFALLPVRLHRATMHFAERRPRDGERPEMRWPALASWLIEGTLKVIDALGIGEGYETLADWIKPNSRPLRPEELRLARTVFGTSLSYWRVRIDEYAFLGPPQGRICYVSFYHINSWGRMDERTLVHELVHVWQYQHMGIAYIPRALRAQRSREGYNYGGAAGLQAARQEGRPLSDFNCEQQADIVADFYCLQVGRAPRWGKAGPEEIPLYRHFVDQLRHSGPNPDYSWVWLRNRLTHE